MGVSLRKAAEQLGMSHTGLRKLAEAGKVPRNADKTFDVDACRLAMGENLDPDAVRIGRENAKAVKPAQARAATQIRVDDHDDGTGVPPLALSRRRKEAALAKMRELDAQKQDKELVELAPVNRYIVSMHTKIREIFVRMGDEFCDRWALESDPAEIRKSYNREVDRALGESSEYIPDAV